MSIYDQPAILPYDEPRNLDQDAWFLYATTSIPYYELCAKRCEDFAHFFNRLITGHDARGLGKVDYWVSRYLTHAENIRRGIEFIKVAGDYMPMHGFLNSPASDWRGLIENAFGYQTRDEWNEAFDALGTACGMGSETLRNAYQDSGLHWLDRANIPSDRRYLVDRDDGHVGDLGGAIALGKERGSLNPPPRYPQHVVDRTIHARPGERCPRSGVWIPEQGLKEYSLAFCIEGRPMQPAYHIIHREVNFPFEGGDQEMRDEWLQISNGSPVTRAEDTTWYFVAAPATDQPLEPSPYRGRCEAGQPCPREGYWLTPARPNSRRHFKQGELMPDTQSRWGVTIWQWDEQQ